MVEGGASQLRDSGIVLFSVISAHFSQVGVAKPRTSPLLGHGPSDRSTSRYSESGNMKMSLGIYSSSPSMLHVYSPLVMSLIVSRDMILQIELSN